MKRYMKYLVNLPLIAALIGGVMLYNYTMNQRQRLAIHVEIMGRLMEGAHAKELKPLRWEAVATGKSGDTDVTSLAGKSVVLVGYGKPSNHDHIRDLGSIASMGGMDPCCPKPISYRNVTKMALTPLPYHCYFWKEAPVSVEVDLPQGKPVGFVADQPGFYRGTLEVREQEGRTVLALKDAEKVDTSKGNAFGNVPKMPAVPGAAY